MRCAINYFIEGTIQDLKSIAAIGAWEKTRIDANRFIAGVYSELVKFEEQAQGARTNLDYSAG
jgi:hypothetical protein